MVVDVAHMRSWVVHVNGLGMDVAMERVSVGYDSIGSIVRVYAANC